MITDMPRPRPPFLHRETTRHGRGVWYVRIGKGPRVRLTAEYGTPEFTSQYNAALQGERPPGPDPRGVIAKPRSLRWLIDRYRAQSAEWAALSDATRRQRENVFTRVIKQAGDDPYARVTKNTISAAIAKRKPGAARHFLQSMRGVFKWAVAVDLASHNPTDGARVKMPKTGGFKPWSEEWCAAYEKQWPLGTHERVWYEIIHCTGLRRGDAVRVGRPHVKGTRGMIPTEKNDETAYFIVSPRLQRALKAGPVGDLTWIVGKKGQPLKKESFGNLFRGACNAAGVSGSAHGIRKTRAMIEAEKGASGPRLDALFGWRTGSNTSAIYIRTANRERLAFGEPKANTYSRTMSSGAGAAAKTRKKTNA